MLASVTSGLSVDRIEEFRAVTSPADAELGRGVGQIQVLTRSGTNGFHGSLFNEHRDRSLNANSYFSNLNKLPKPRYRYNTWSYNVGGPVILPGINKGRNKLFFFWSQEYWPLKGSSAVTRLTRAPFNMARSVLKSLLWPVKLLPSFISRSLALRQAGR